MSDKSKYKVKPIIIRLNPNKTIEWKSVDVGPGGKEFNIKKSANWDYRKKR